MYNRTTIKIVIVDHVSDIELVVSQIEYSEFHPSCN